MDNHLGYAQHSHTRNGWMISHIPLRHGPPGPSAPLCTRTKRLYPTKKKIIRKYPKPNPPKKKGENEKRKKKGIIYIRRRSHPRTRKETAPPMLISGLLFMPPPSWENPLMSTKRTVFNTPLNILHINLVPFMHLIHRRNNAYNCTTMHV